MAAHTVKANIVTTDKMLPVELHFGHAVDRGIGYGQLWFSPSEHLEFTRAGLLELARLAIELAEGL